MGFYSLNVPFGDPRFGDMYHCECTAKTRSARLQAVSGLLPEENRLMLSDITRSGPGTIAMLDRAYQFVIQPAAMVTLWGGSGNAKTMILQAIVNESIELGRVAVYVTMLDLIEYIRAAYAERQDGRHESAALRLDRYASVQVLCIDEVDKVKDTDWTIERQTALIDKRYRLGLSGVCGTVLAMNQNPDTLPDWIYSRLSDGRNTIIHNADPDLRRYMR